MSLMSINGDAMDLSFAKEEPVDDSTGMASIPESPTSKEQDEVSHPYPVIT